MSAKDESAPAAVPAQAADVPGSFARAGQTLVEQKAVELVLEQAELLAADKRWSE